jgi:hypothetical protein
MADLFVAYDNVSSSLGSGTHTDWTIVIGGHQTTASASPLGVADGGTGAGTHSANGVLLDDLVIALLVHGFLSLA